MKKLLVISDHLSVVINDKLLKMIENPEYKQNFHSFFLNMNEN